MILAMAKLKQARLAVTVAYALALVLSTWTRSVGSS